MPDRLWEGFESTLQITLGRGDHPVPRPTPEALEAYEKTVGFKFPESYREWILAVGPGELVNNFVIYAPGYPESDITASLERYDKLYDRLRKMDDKRLELSKDPNLVRSIRPFGKTQLGETLGWDPQEATDPARHEHPVYLVDRTQDLHRLASTFRGFIQDYVYGAGYEKWLGGWNTRKLGPRHKFQPASRF